MNSIQTKNYDPINIYQRPQTVILILMENICTTTITYITHISLNITKR